MPSLLNNSALEAFRLCAI